MITIINLTDIVNLKRSDKYVALSNLSMFYAWKNNKKLCKNNKIKVSVLTLNEEFQLPDSPYSLWFTTFFSLTFKIILNLSQENIDKRLIKLPLEYM